MKKFIFISVYLIVAYISNTNLYANTDQDVYVTNIDSLRFYLTISRNFVKPSHVSLETCKLECISKSKYGYTPLFIASANGDLPLVRYLVEEKEQPCDTIIQIHTPLILAIYSQNESLIEYLISKGANVKKREESIVFFDSKPQKHKKITVEICPLFFALKTGNVKIVDLLVSNGAKIQDSYLETPLITIAILSGHANIVKYMIDNRCDLLDAKLKDESFSFFKYLDPSNWFSNDEYIPLYFFSAFYGDLEVLKLYKDQNEDFKCITKKTKNNIFHSLASCHNRIDWGNEPKIADTRIEAIFNFLISCNLSTYIDLPDESNKTPLYFAVTSNNITLAKLLLQRKANVNVQDNMFYTTPLMHAIYKRNYKMIELLLRYNANIKLKNHLGEDVFDIVKKIKKSEEKETILKMLHNKTS